MHNNTTQGIEPGTSGSRLWSGSSSSGKKSRSSRKVSSEAVPPALGGKSRSSLSRGVSEKKGGRGGLLPFHTENAEVFLGKLRSGGSLWFMTKKTGSNADAGLQFEAKTRKGLG